MFRIGFEIHRQISYNKLFCTCKYTKDSPIHKVESGLPTSLDSYWPLKNHTYYYKNVCDYELDEAPPVFNEVVLESLLRILKEFNYTPVSKVNFMRKRIFDGSLKSGYQRTAIVGYDGYLYYKDRKINLPFIYLEEDSSTPHEGGWNLHRQGMPLVEVVTEPLELSPIESREVLKLIGFKLRKHTLVTGMGTIRQDINIDAGYGKVELKGVQDIQLVPEIIQAEVARQLRDKDGSHTRKVINIESEYMRGEQTAARLEVETEVPFFSLPPLPELDYSYLDTVTHPDLRVSLEESYYLQPYLKQVILDNSLAQLFLKLDPAILVALLNQGKSAQQIKAFLKLNEPLENFLAYKNITPEEIPMITDRLKYYKENEIRIYSYTWLNNILNDLQKSMGKN